MIWNSIKNLIIESKKKYRVNCGNIKSYNSMNK